MSFSLTKTHPRLWSLDAGVAMVVTDLHGDWDAYARYRDRFLALHAAGQADCLIFTGDLIHREPGHGPDQSLEIIADILALRAQYGDSIIYLSGNHELPHCIRVLLKLTQAGKDRVCVRVRPPRPTDWLTRHGRGDIGQALVLLEQQPMLTQARRHRFDIAHSGPQ